MATNLSRQKAQKTQNRNAFYAGPGAGLTFGF
jgi:hypothetical protein